jgi:hypothetical protein
MIFMKGVIVAMFFACLYTQVISSANGDMYVWMLLSNNAIV